MMQALFHLNEQDSRLKNLDLPPLLQGQVLLRSLYSMVSLGTERLVATGQVPASTWPYMEVPYQDGDFSFPIKYGYSLVARVEKGPIQLLGKEVHLMHPHQDICIVAEEAVFPLPGDVPPARATLASNMETAVNAIWDARLKPGSRVLIVGFGMIGALLAGCLRKEPGREFFVLETDPRRKKLAESLGLKCLSEENQFDIVFHTSATASGLQSAIDLAGFEGKVIELSWYGERSVELNLGASFHHQRKVIQSSQVSHIPTHVPEMDFRKRKEIVFEILQDAWFDGLLEEAIPFEKLPDFFGKLRRQKLSGVSGLIRYPASESRK